MIELFLEPLDVWLFRDGRPFDAGLQHRAESLFPPPGSVVAGAIRSKYLSLKGYDLSTITRQEIEREVGTSTQLNGLRIHGPAVAVQDEGTNSCNRFYPQPADAVTDTSILHGLRPANGPTLRPPNLKTSLTTDGLDSYLIGLKEEPIKGEGGLWLQEKDLCDYLNGKLVCGVPGKELFSKELRPGNSLQNTTKTSKPGMLFEVEFIRPKKKTGLWIGIEGEKYESIWPDQGILQIGGEQRAAAFFKLANSNRIPPTQTNQDKSLRIYLITPAIFDCGWRSTDWNKFFQNKVELKAAALNRFISTGGFDLVNKDHKPARRFVPAGSVYYFESVDGSPIQLVNQALTDFDADFGLGSYLTGRW